MITLLEAEQAFVGSCLFAKDTATYALDLLKPNQITHEPQRMAYTAVMRLLRAGQDPSDNALLSNYMEKEGYMEAVGGPVGLAMMYDCYTSIDNLPSYADIIIAEASMTLVRNTLVDNLQRVGKDDPAEIIGDVKAAFSEHETVHAPMRAISMQDVAGIAFNEGTESGATLSTGIDAIDRDLQP